MKNRTENKIIIIRQRSKSRHCRVAVWQRQGKGEEQIKKEVEAQKVEPPTPTRATDALIGDEKQKKGEKEIGRGPPTQLSWTIRSPLTTRTDHTVGIF